MEMQAFDKADYDAFAGAEGWGEEHPLAFHGKFQDTKKEFVFILDSNGMCLVIEGDPQNDEGGYAANERGFATQESAAAFARVLDLERSHEGAVQLFRQLGA